MNDKEENLLHTIVLLLQIIQDIKYKLNDLKSFAKNKGDFYTIGFIDGVINFIDEELKKILEEKEDK